MNTSATPHATPSDQARAELAPNGTLRLAFPQASALYITRDPATGTLRGVSMDLGAALAERLGVPFDAKPYKAVRELIADTGKGAWDIATIVIEDERRKIFDFSRAYLEADSTYLVPAGSTIQKIADADKPGIRIGVAENSAFDLFLTRFVKAGDAGAFRRRGCRLRRPRQRCMRSGGRAAPGAGDGAKPICGIAHSRRLV